jgi:2-polyprenyl-3-methyl-5-hydroxy-6-metoxy-1,4-benzoquinol methylase
MSNEISVAGRLQERAVSGNASRPAGRPTTVYSVIGHVPSLYGALSSLVGYQRSVEFFVSQFPFPKHAPIKVLDAGCGTGLYALAVLRQFQRASVTAFDLNEKLVASCCNKPSDRYVRRLRWFTGDIQGPLAQLGADKFDLIITAGVLEHVPATKTVNNLARFLKDDGYFFNSPVRDTSFGKTICRVYGCAPYSREENIRSFAANGFYL